MSFGSSVQAAVYTALTGDVSLMAAVEGVYDNVPQAIDTGSAAAFPYVTIGEDSLAEWDTDDSLGAQGSITVHTWSRARGRKECKDIQGLVYNALTRAELVLSGYTLVTVEFEGEQSFLDPDGLTRHGVSTFRIILDEV